MHCSDALCDGDRVFRCISGDAYIEKEGKYLFVTYLCSNCRKSSKVFALLVKPNTSYGLDGQAMKLGELPSFGPITPARVITLIGPDREFFLQGRRAENRGLGIGAFAYYRRVVENQKSRIIEEIGKVARKLGAPPDVLSQFEAAAQETQFTKAIDMIKSAIPSVLLIDGRNPLTLLHGALSEGIHADKDADCLEIAQSIRVILTDLAERMSQVLKDHTELRGAVSKLLTRKSTSTAPPVPNVPSQKSPS